ncbi:hypothetical protein HMPREF1544_01905 [Mucor circinelloides 1006PhL]|uniref:Uncharacterized protein n=1 Tax=Mucor circinelloides f. circinelloides (strain 1006PhL) TaxID=1220926 RepID=S2KFP3_MUCC1|nr:hypothetical protein HMPREF1544_01905 [Mucor circinelloides 1006PhL]
MATDDCFKTKENNAAIGGEHSFHLRYCHHHHRFFEVVSIAISEYDSSKTSGAISCCFDSLCSMTFAMLFLSGLVLPASHYAITFWFQAICKSFQVLLLRWFGTIIFCKSFVVLRFLSSVDYQKISSKHKVVLKDIKYKICCELFISLTCRQA